MALSTEPLVPTRKALSVAVETTKGTANYSGTPDVSTLFYGSGGGGVPTLQPGQIFQGGERSPISDTAGDLPSIKQVQEGILRFRTELINGDVTATLLQGCGMVSDGGTPAKHVFTIDRSQHKTLSFELWEDGRKKKLRGASGSFTMNADTAAGRVFMDWQFSGIMEAPVDESIPTMSVPTTAPFKAEDMTFTFNGSDLPAKPGFTIDSGVNVSVREDADDPLGVAYFMASPGVPTLSVEPEATTIANHDPYGELLSATSAAIAIVLKDAGTNTLPIDAQNAQRQTVTDSSRNDTLTDAVTFALFSTSAGGDNTLGTGDALELTL